MSPALVFAGGACQADRADIASRAGRSIHEPGWAFHPEVDDLRVCRGSHSPDDHPLAVVRSAFHAHDGGEICPSVLRRLGWRVVLARGAPDSSITERVTGKNIATATGPKQVSRRVVLLAAVDVANLDVTSGSAETTDL
jgi:hypothetical protein